MGKIDELIQQYCPDGVEYEPLGKVCLMERGTSATKGTMQTGEIPVISGGRQPAFYCNQSNRTGETITIAGSGAGAGYVQYWNEPIFVCDAFSIKGSDNITTKFIYYFLASIQEQIYSTKKGGGVPHVHISSIDKFEIPLPPLPVQEAIVNILDRFAVYAAELQAELQARQQQYNYYRDTLLSFEGRTDVQWKKLGEVADLGTGSHNTQDGLVEGKYPFYTRGSEILYLNDYDYDETAIITAGDGAGVGKVFHFVQGKYALHQRAYRIVPNEKIVLARFAYYYIGATFYNYIMKSSVSSSVVSIRKPMMVDYPIPVPSVKEQERVISILDNFYSLTNDLSQGLPAEIEARRQQYEYYRDKLLTFKRK